MNRGYLLNDLCDYLRGPESNLEELDLRDNALNTSHIIGILNSILSGPLFSKLTKLDLSDNFISKEAACILIEMIKSGQMALQHLLLCDTNITMKNELIVAFGESNN